MKAKIKDCSRCRQDIIKAVKKEFVESQYRFYQDFCDSFAMYSTCAVLTAMARRGKTKDYIRKIFDDMVMVFSTSDVFGNEITMNDMIKSLEAEYDIDFGRIKCHIETKHEFMKGSKD